MFETSQSIAVRRADKPPPLRNGLPPAAMHRGALRAAALLALLASLPLAAAPSAADFRQRLPEDEVIYFLLPDRFENADRSNDRGGRRGDRHTTGFDPTDKAYYHGGDLRGVTARLDYIAALGASALWLGPIYTNKPVQGPPGRQSAGYHGYWITDFTNVDPHFGTRQDLQDLIATAHARGIKVYLDIITNHTADVISYRECPDGGCAYRARADYPYSTRGGLTGVPINDGFLGDTVQTAENFARLTRTDHAYSPYVPAAEAHVKVPAWLNDPIWYHNRGNSTFAGESLQHGDFSGLDDLMTEHPRVLQGFIDIYGAWIDDFGVDGFRVDTAKFVNPQFWQALIPAMLERARARGIVNFHIFGEVWSGEVDPALLARATRVDKFPAVLDFAWRAALLQTLAGSAGTEQLVRLFDGDALYEGGPASALRLPTFISSHDNGRFAYHVRQAFPQADDAEVLKRVILAHAMLLTLRGVPVIYSGDEQGFAGDGEDKDGREDLFPSQVAEYNDNRLVGSAASTAHSNFDRNHPIFRAIAELAGLRRQHAALRRGQQIIRRYQERPGLFAVSRLDPQSGAEILAIFNTSNAPVAARIEVDYRSVAFQALHGPCAAAAAAPGSYQVALAPFGYAICAATNGRSPVPRAARGNDAAH